jgi:hypothetical protein
MIGLGWNQISRDLHRFHLAGRLWGVISPKPVRANFPIAPNARNDRLLMLVSQQGATPLTNVRLAFSQVGRDSTQPRGLSETPRPALGRVARPNNSGGDGQPTRKSPLGVIPWLDNGACSESSYLALVGLESAARGHHFRANAQ